MENTSIKLDKSTGGICVLRSGDPAFCGKATIKRKKKIFIAMIVFEKHLFITGELGIT